MDWLGWAGLTLSFIGAGVAVWARIDAHKALEAARKSASSSERTTRISEELFEEGKVRFELRSVPGRIDHFELVNNGTHPAYNVRIDAPQVHVTVKVFETTVFLPGMRHPIVAEAPLSADDHTVIVTFKKSKNGPDEVAEFYT